MKMQTYLFVRGTASHLYTSVFMMRLLDPAMILGKSFCQQSSNRSLTSAASIPIPTLLGPPEIYRESTTATAATSTTATATTAISNGDSFVDLMVANFNKTARYDRNVPAYPAMMGLTENNSPTFLSTGNPCLDFFFHVVPDTPPESLINRLQLAWDQDSLKSLKLIYNLRGVRGTGKSDMEGFYTCALWLHDHHPKTLAGNVASVADFGYFKDLLEILFRVLEGPQARKMIKAMRPMKKWKLALPGYKIELPKLYTMSPKERGMERAKRVVERFKNDSQFRFLHDRVSEVFAQCLRSDMKMLRSGNRSDLFKISLAAKWCPSLDHSFDRITLICESIGKKVFPREEYPEYQGLEEAHYAFRVRERLRKEVLTPLRKALELPEVYMSANDWGNLPYNRVASVAMKTYKELFLKHDKDRFEGYLEKVKSGKAKIAAGALLPHELIKQAFEFYSGDIDEVAELQWQRMVDDLAKEGKLNNCLAICDVSGSMYGTPLEVSVALGLLVSELSEDPWKGKLITFSEYPELHIVEGKRLGEKTRFVQNMDWNLNTDFQKVFDLILKVAVNGKLRPDDMIKRLFVFSDMEFDQASLRPWETDYEAIVRKFRENGYGDCVPEIVFWNLRESKATPVPSHQPGVALVSGFSKNLMRLFLEEGGILTPEAAMDRAISGKEYQKLLLLD